MAAVRPGLTLPCPTQVSSMFRQFYMFRLILVIQVSRPGLRDRTSRARARGWMPVVVRTGHRTAQRAAAGDVQAECNPAMPCTATLPGELHTSSRSLKGHACVTVAANGLWSQGRRHQGLWHQHPRGAGQRGRRHSRAAAAAAGGVAGRTGGGAVRRAHGRLRAGRGELHGPAEGAGAAAWALGSRYTLNAEKACKASGRCT